MTHYDMSGSEDGQLRSPGDEQFMSGDDADSLDIKPPQANVAHSRDSTGSRRKEKSVKERKHSKEKKHRERGGRDRERDRTIVGIGSEGERRGGIERSREHRRDDRSELERYHQRTSGGGSGGGGYGERDDGGCSREIMLSERRYQKHYEQRSSDDGGGGGGGRRGGNHNYHPQSHQYHQQLHMQRQRQDYYERGQGYHHGGGSDYYGNRHQGYYNKHGGGGGGGGGGVNVDVASFELQRERERRKYSYEQPKDAESLEQDLRSRLLSKRHKYVKNNDEAEEPHYEPHQQRRSDPERNERERAKAERHKTRREKEHESVIEVLDSPEAAVEMQQRRKHKRRPKEREDEDEVLLALASVEKRKTPDDPELLARRAKILAAEREKEKRKESAREELAARREMRRGRAEASSALSPSAVAASVTAGLNVVKRKKESEAAEQHIRRKRAKQTTRKHSDDDVEELDDDDDDDEEEEDDCEDSELNVESETESDSSDGDSDKSYERRKSKKKAENRTGSHLEVDHSDEELPLPESPLSIGELSKSPKHQRRKRKSKKSVNADANEQEHRLMRSPHSARLHSHSVSHSRSHTHSRSRSSSPTPSGSHSRSHSHSAHRRRSRSRSHTHSRSNSRSHSASSHSRSHSRSRTHSKSRSRSRSGTRSEERDMHANARRCEAADAKEAETGRRKTQHEGEESPARDEKGVPLPNYYPGVQGCRSVEEFQCLNRIEEGTYGVVYRAKDKRTNEIVALKRLKMEKEKEGFPITSLREINTLLKGQHPNIVTVREIVVGSNMDKIFIVMDYVEHDLKSLMETMKHRKQCFLPGEVKCLTQQLLRAVGHLHDNWILHRDLKTSNLLLSHKGILKVGDFGLAREYGSPLKKYTSLVVTLWYRAPELLLCSPEYSTPIDIWSVGCIYGEFLQMAPMFPGKTEIDELNKIFKELGTPNEKIWPGYKELPAFKNIISQNSQFAEYPISNLKKRFNDKTSELGISLLQGLLTYDPKQRLTADAALKHAYFKELPLPIDPSMFPTWPAKSELGARKALASSPKPPSGGSQFKQLGRDDIIAGGGGGANVSVIGSGKVVSGIITGNKKTAANTGFVLNAGIEQRQLAMGPGFSLKF